MAITSEIIGRLGGGGRGGYTCGEGSSAHQPRATLAGALLISKGEGK